MELSKCRLRSFTRFSNAVILTHAKRFRTLCHGHRSGMLHQDTENTLERQGNTHALEIASVMYKFLIGLSNGTPFAVAPVVLFATTSSPASTASIEVPSVTSYRTR
jgi:hypothetical protein